MKKIILKGYIVVPKNDLEAVKKEVKDHINLTRGEAGCLEFHVDQDKNHKSKFYVYEKFKDQESFQAHQDRVQRSYWGRITKNVERHYQIYEEA